MIGKNKGKFWLFLIALSLIIVAGCSPQTGKSGSNTGMMGSNADMMSMLNKDPDKMAEAMSSPDTRESMVKIMGSNTMFPAMLDMMKTPELQQNMIKIMSDPSMKETMIEMMSNSAMKEQLIQILKDPRLKPIALESIK